MFHIFTPLIVDLPSFIANFLPNIQLSALCSAIITATIWKCFWGEINSMLSYKSTGLNLHPGSQQAAHLNVHSPFHWVPRGTQVG